MVVNIRKGKGTKKYVLELEIVFKNYKNSLFNNEIILKLQQKIRIDYRKVYTEEVNKIALSSNDDKRLQTFDKIATYLYGTNAFKVRENEMMKELCKLSVL